jgi:hypothetical protein
LPVSLISISTFLLNLIFPYDFVLQLMSSKFILEFWYNFPGTKLCAIAPVGSHHFKFAWISFWWEVKSWDKINY